MKREKHSRWNRDIMQPMPDSPVEQIRKTLPQGDGNWPGSEKVYSNIQKACHAMARSNDTYLSEEHINAMAILGCGHEETMKAEQMRLRDRGWL